MHDSHSVCRLLKGSDNQHIDKTYPQTVAYWILTLLMVMPTAGSGIPELFLHGPAQPVQSLQTLGYPLYLMKILGLAKVLGAITVLANRPVRFVEWAYAGFSFLFLGATASHMLANDATHAPVPFCFFLLLLGSYKLHRQVRS